MDVHDTIGFDLIDARETWSWSGTAVRDRLHRLRQGGAREDRSDRRGHRGRVRAGGRRALGGETAEHPGLLEPDEYDVAGATTGVVEKDRILGPHLVRPGDQVVALASSGLHSNGYSLVRHVLLNQAGWDLGRHVPELGRTLGEELLVPTRVYARDILAMIDAAQVHAISHITGGGLANNLARVLPDGTSATLDRSSWTPQPIFTGATGGRRLAAGHRGDRTWGWGWRSSPRRVGRPTAVRGVERGIPA